MKWTAEAEDAVKKVPFFVRKRVRSRVEKEAEAEGKPLITLADCPNACSQPQIKDIGIIGACVPKITQIPCSLCEACVEACREQAVSLSDESPVIRFDRCLSCGQCIQVCSTGTLGDGDKGYRVLLGGKLGRHPKLARELPGIFSEDAVLSIVKDCLLFYRLHSNGGERFAEIFTEQAFEETSAGIYRNYRLIEGIGDGCKKE